MFSIMILSGSINPASQKYEEGLSKNLTLCDKLAFLEERMSSMISSAVLSSCQRPAKLFVHPFSPDGSDTAFAIGEEGDKVIAFIMICLLLGCKNRNK